MCHVLEVDAGYTCKMHNNGSHPGACLRVQELFSICPQVGNWKDNANEMCIVFVTDKMNVDLDKHTMRNVPKKHVGIFSEGLVYHYSNTADLVISQRAKDFLARFQGSYGGKQGLFFGTFPSGATIPDLANAVSVPASVSVNGNQGMQPVIRPVPVSGGKKDYYATLPGVNEFYVARSTSYLSNEGLYQPSSKLEGPRYKISDFTGRYETVAGLLGVIAAGESGGYFNRLNSYDRAAFTFGFLQLAAHTPKDNLILLFRRLAAENTAFQGLFPDLKVIDGVLHRLVGTHSVSLEKAYPRPGHPNELNLKDFMSYLNPDLAKVDDLELSVTARMVHLANMDEEANALQVKVAADITMGKLRDRYAHWYGLDGVSDLICTAIADIHHQGRGTKTQVKAALAAGSTVQKKLDALCKIGGESYASRCATLKRALAQAKADGHLGISVFDQGSGLFKPTEGWLE
ncbi:hypothetical protein [Prosthecobacter fusiformis]|uniref:hypothetical protein n=1 Tax=Prosthecobacter fusiformis TaxID=48464 RepID=UPI00105FC394|nr:hypothetical protein [Prosthecobacter fusiformis]